MNEYLPLIAVGIAGVLAIPTYLFQKWIERRDELRKTKAQAYEHFLSAHWARPNKYLSGDEKEKAWADYYREYSIARHSLFLIASDEVLKNKE